MEGFLHRELQLRATAENKEFPNGTIVKLSWRGLKWKNSLPTKGTVVGRGPWGNMVWVLPDGKEDIEKNHLALNTNEIEIVR